MICNYLFSKHDLTGPSAQAGKVTCLNIADMLRHIAETKVVAYSKPIKLLLFNFITKNSPPKIMIADYWAESHALGSDLNNYQKLTFL